MTTPFPSRKAMRERPSQFLKVSTTRLLLRREVHLGHLVGLERVRVLHLLAARLLADLPVHLGDAARRAPAADEADRRVADLDLARDVEDLDLRVEVVASAEGSVPH